MQGGWQGRHPHALIIRVLFPRSLIARSAQLEGRRDHAVRPSQGARAMQYNVAPRLISRVWTGTFNDDRFSAWPLAATTTIFVPLASLDIGIGGRASPCAPRRNARVWGAAPSDLICSLSQVLTQNRIPLCGGELRTTSYVAHPRRRCWIDLERRKRAAGTMSWIDTSIIISLV